MHSYQRGTDITNCHDGCDGLIWNETPECSVANDCNFTCPREQAEKPKAAPMARGRDAALVRRAANYLRRNGVLTVSRLAEAQLLVIELSEALARRVSEDNAKERTNG